MAKKTAVSRSQHIRDYLVENPNAKPKEIVETLGKRGIKVTSNLVSMTKYNQSKKPAKKKVATKTAPKPKAPTATSDPLDAAINFVEQAGGFSAAKSAIERIERIRRL